MYNGLFDPNDARVRRFQPVDVKAHRFNQGAEVQFIGSRHPALKDKKGVIDGHVAGEQHKVAVTFEEMPPEDRHYIFHELTDLTEWRGRPKTDRVEKDDKKEVKVEKRKGVAKGKRKNQDEE